MMQAPILDHLLVLIVVLYGLVAIFRGQPQLKTMTFDTPTKLSVYYTNGLLLWILAIAAGVVWWLGDRPLGDLGLRVSHDHLAAGLVLSAAFVLWMAFEAWRQAGSPQRRERLRARWTRDVPFLPATRRETVHFGFMGVTAGITEEIVMRGFLVRYLELWFGSSAAGLVVAVLIPAVFFAVVHRYQGPAMMLQILVLALIFGAIFVITGSLLLPIILHSLVDVAGGIVAWRLASNETGPDDKTSAPASPAGADR